MNPLYKGEIFFRKEHGGDKGIRRVKTHESQVGGIFPEQAIVTPALWNAAHTRLKKTMAVLTSYRSGDGRLAGRPTSGLDSRHLLSGYLSCGNCGGPMKLLTVSREKSVKRYYVCSGHLRGKGDGALCRSAVPFDALEHAIRTTPALQRDAVLAEVDRYRGALYAELFTIPDPLASTEQADLARLDAELGRLTEAIVVGGDLKPLVDRMNATQARRDDLAASLAQRDSLKRT